MENSIISHRWDPIIHSTWWNAMDSMWEMECARVCVCVPSLNVWGWADSTHYICQRIIWEGVYYVICEASVLIITSALFFSLWRVGKRQPVRRYPNNMKLHGNLEIDKLFICVLCSSPFLPYCSASEWLRHGIPERLGLLLGLHRLNSFRSSPTILTPSVDPFYLSAVSSLDEGGEHAWLPWCLGSENVTGLTNRRVWTDVCCV